MAETYTLKDNWEEVLPEYIQKWQQITSQTGPVDVEKVKEAMKTQYRLQGFPTDNLIFVRASSSVDVALILAGTDILLTLAAREGSKWKWSPEPIEDFTDVTNYDDCALKVILEGIRAATTPVGETYVPGPTAYLSPDQNPYDRVTADYTNHALQDVLAEIVGELYRRYFSDEISHADLIELVLVQAKTWYDRYLGTAELAIDAGTLQFVEDQANWVHPETEKYRSHQALAETVSTIGVLPSVCIFSDLVQTFLHDENDDLHCDNGPCIRWYNRMERYTIHGQDVTKKIVMTPELLTIKEIDEERDVDVRQIMIERFGIARYLREIDAKILDSRHSLRSDKDLTEMANTSPNPEQAAAAAGGVALDLNFDPNLADNHAETLYSTKDCNYLRVWCATDREFFLPVPPEVQTCQAAQQWLNTPALADCRLLTRT